MSEFSVAEMILMRNGSLAHAIFICAIISVGAGAVFDCRVSRLSIIVCFPDFFHVVR